MGKSQFQVTVASRNAAQQNLVDFLASVNAHINGDWSQHKVAVLYDTIYPELGIASDQSGAYTVHSIPDSKCLRIQVRDGDTVRTVCVPAIEVGDADSAGPGGGTEDGDAPTIQIHPSSKSVQHGGTLQLAVTAIGTDPLLYQWRKDGANLVGKTSSVLTVTNFSSADAGTYTVVVFNTFGTVVSQEAVVTLLGSSSSSSSSFSSSSSAGA